MRTSSQRTCPPANPVRFSWLIGLRIYRGWTQKQLAEKLSVSETQISKDERNEYHNVSTEKAQRILRVLGANFSLEIEDLEPIEAALA